MGTHLSKHRQVPVQLRAMVLTLLPDVGNLLGVVVYFVVQGRLRLSYQVTMMLPLYTSFQAQLYEQSYCDGEKMQEEITQSMNLFVGHVNIQHGCSILANRVPAGSYL